MKLRFRKNSLRLRINQQEAALLAAGQELREEVSFGHFAKLGYSLVPLQAGLAGTATFDGREIRVCAPLRDWAQTEEVGFYFDASEIKVAIEKDLECLDGPEEERDPQAFPRKSKDC